METFKNAKKDFLCDVLRILTMPEHADAQAQHVGLKAVDHFSNGSLVPLETTSDQVGVF